MPAAASSQNGAPDQSPLVRSTSTFVLVPVRAQSESGAPIQYLDTGQLRITDNGVPQRAVDVKTDGLPTSLVILMQTGGRGKLEFASYVDLARLLDDVLGSSGHEITFVSFDSKIEEIWHFPARPDGLTWALNHPHPGDNGAAILDAVSFGVRQLQAEPGRFRRIVLLLGQDFDEDSRTSPQDMIQQLGTASTVVYSLTFRAASAKKRRAVAARTQAKPFSPDFARAVHLLAVSSASEIAALTGGSSIAFKDRASFDSALLEVADDIANTRTLGFQPSEHVPGFHSLRVLDPSRPRTGIAARSAYWFIAPGRQN